MGLPATFDGFREYVTQGMATYRVPGMAIAIVQDGEVVFSEGFGYRDVEKQLPVTPTTVFAIASSSKAFTTMAMGMLADEGKLDWDKPVREYLPYFRMHDRFAWERMTPRDLVCHRCGLPRHDFVWYASPLSRKEIVERLGYLEPNQDFRTVFQYQNLMFITAGVLVSELAGCSWDEFVCKRIFEPLGMTGSSTSVIASQAAPDHSLPYIEIKDTVKPVSFRNMDNAGPAGSINSSITDMANWVKLHLAKGKVGDRVLISEANLAQMHTPHVPILPANDPLAMFAKYPEMTPPAYGLGWFMQSYRGHPVIHHGGSIDGFIAFVSFMPQDNLGMVILSNLGGTMFPEVATFHTYDLLLGLEPAQWAERILKEAADLKKQTEAAQQAVLPPRVPDTQPSHPLDAYAGAYEHPAYGTISIARTGDGLSAVAGPLQPPLRHHHYDLFAGKIEFLAERPMPVAFHTDNKGAICSLSVPLEPMAKPIVFARKVEKE